jgi:hypothetical protein
MKNNEESDREYFKNFDFLKRKKNNLQEEDLKKVSDNQNKNVSKPLNVKYQTHGQIENINLNKTVKKVLMEKPPPVDPMYDNKSKIIYNIL